MGKDSNLNQASVCKISVTQILATLASLQLGNKFVVNGCTFDGDIQVHSQFSIGLVNDGGFHHLSFSDASSQGQGGDESQVKN